MPSARPRPACTSACRGLRPRARARSRRRPWLADAARRTSLRGTCNAAGLSRCRWLPIAARATMLSGQRTIDLKICEVQPGVRCSSMASASRCRAVARLTTLVRAVPAFISVPWNQLREWSRCKAEPMWPSFCKSSQTISVGRWCAAGVGRGFAGPCRRLRSSRRFAARSGCFARPTHGPRPLENPRPIAGCRAVRP